jgi:hypothetical protein
MSEYKWIINAIPSAPSEDGLTDVVKSVHWQYQAIDGDCIADEFGIMVCNTPSETDFTAYNDLTEDQVIGWLVAALPIEQIKETVDGKIASQKNPPIVNLPLPWIETVSTEPEADPISTEPEAEQ